MVSLKRKKNSLNGRKFFGRVKERQVLLRHFFKDNLLVMFHRNIFKKIAEFRV
jgi:hypothetical protein